MHFGDNKGMSSAYLTALQLEQVLNQRVWTSLPNFGVANVSSYPYMLDKRGVVISRVMS